ncbi:hypothetical protein [Oceanicaulis sp.]|uniref:hypothetical protein n=1 Tax=Oceanicaulis sp. TaxID=1924941 RepID=UPI003D2AE3B3
MDDDDNEEYESYWEFFLRSKSGRIYWGQLEYFAYSRMFYLLHHKVALEPELVAKAEKLADLYSEDIVNVLDDATHELAEAHDIELPEFHIPDDNELTFQLLWNRARKHYWDKQHVGHG